MKYFVLITFFIWSGTFKDNQCLADYYSKKLYDHLKKGYNKMIIPVRDNRHAVTVTIDLKLSHIIDIDEKNQIMTTDVWLTQIWNDYRMAWDLKEYNNISTFHMPASEIWTPDVVLYNTANGKYEFTSRNNVEIHYDGTVICRIPAILKSSCTIDVEYFPFDEQCCFMRFSSWTYDSEQLHITHMKIKDDNQTFIEQAVDMAKYAESIEWDILSVTAQLNNKKNYEHNNYEEFYEDIKFYLSIRRKTLFYTINLIIPCLSFGFLTIVVFSLSTKSGEKITLCISILLALTLFFLPFLDMMPPTSLVVPLLGKYLVFTINMLALSIFLTIFTINIHNRTPSLHSKMPDFVRKFLLTHLARLLLVNKEKEFVSKCLDQKYSDYKLICNSSRSAICSSRKVRPLANRLSRHFQQKVVFCMKKQQEMSYRYEDVKEPKNGDQMVLSNAKLLDCLEDVVNNIDFEIETRIIKTEWEKLAFIFDRLIIILFGILYFVGTAYIFLKAPSLQFYNTAVVEDSKHC